LAASIDPSRRGETLTIEEFVRLYQRSGEASGDNATGLPQRHAPAS
jgi:16S rRNA (adenine1518-N6/adenine1519-N6)-dimethyltransferase